VNTPSGVASDQGCLYSLLIAPRERHEEILDALVRPVADSIRDHPDLHSLFFVRYSEPVWQLRFRVLGRRGWVEGDVRRDVESRVRDLEAAGTIESHEFQRYDRELERYGGEIGMGLAEKLVHAVSLACLDLLRIDRAGLLKNSRRELAMAVVDRFLDLTGFSAGERIEFYRYGYGWAIELKTWEAEELAVLETRFQKLRPGLEALFYGEAAEDPSRFYGGPEAAAAVARFLERARPIVDAIRRELDAGRIRQHPMHLFWSYTHMMTNRLGVEATPEAILRFFMARLLEERAKTAA
jgi:thiopeptide-type bacteriocin biosynthesis protein